MNDSEWKCSHCGGILGTKSGGYVKVRLKKAQFLISITSEIIGVCPTCQELNRLAPSKCLCHLPKPALGKSK